MNKIERIICVTAGTSAATVHVNGQPCLLQNNSEAACVYFKESRDDGTAATASNSWRLGPGEATTVPLLLRELSVIADTASTDLRILVLDEE